MDLAELRKQINALDETMVDTFVERMKVSAGIAKAKAESNLQVLDKKREQEVLQKVRDMAGEEFELYVNTLYHTLFDMSKTYQAGILLEDSKFSKKLGEQIASPKMEFPRKATVACQGVEGSYAGKAAERLFTMGNLMYFNNFDSVFNAVEKGLCQYGILPVENSTAGSVTEVYDLMDHHKFHIVKSLKLHINHSVVMKKGGDLSKVKEIISHDQALQQCGEFLKSLPNVKVTVFENTATAAKFISESDRDDIAAISSKDCAKLYGLDVVKEDVQNHQNNYTRFICIAKNMEIYGGADKISLMISLEHNPGALYDMIGKVACHGLNLSKIESRPIPGKDFEFRFYFDIEGSVFSSDVVTLLKDMEYASAKFSFLGCYSEL
ncbi:MAG: prephenate dehydratase domain-containing protein [Bacillota bacterium]